MPIVFVPGRGNVNFPNGMSVAQIQKAIETEILPSAVASRRQEALGDVARLRGEVGGLQRDISGEATRPKSWIERAIEGFSQVQTEMPEGPYQRGAAEQIRLREAEAKARGAQAAFMEKEGRVPTRLTTGEGVVEALKAVPREAIRSTAQIGGAAGIAGAPGERLARGIEAAGEKAVTALGLQPAEAVQFDPFQGYVQQYTGGVGSIVPYVVTGVAGAGAKAGLTGLGALNAARAAGALTTAAQTALATGQGAAQARQGIEDYEKKSGQKLDQLDRSLIQAGGAAIGLSELLPIKGMISRLPPSLRGAAIERATRALEAAGAAKVSSALGLKAAREAVEEIERSAAGRIALSSAEEAAQEGASQLAQNVLGTTYNPDQSLTEGVLSSAILGGLVGGSVRGGRELIPGAGPTAPAAPSIAPTTIAPDATPLRTVKIGVTGPDGAPTEADVDIFSEPDDSGLQDVRFPDGSAVKVPAADLAARVIKPPEAEAVAAPEPAATTPPVGVGPGMIDVTDVAPGPAIAPEPVVTAPAPGPVAGAPEPVVIAPEPVAAEPRAAPTLPPPLAKAKPSYAFGDTRIDLNFDNDLDRAVYIASSSTPSKARPKYLGWLKDQGLSDEAEIASLGAQMRKDIKTSILGGVNPAEPLKMAPYSAPKVSAPMPAAPAIEAPAAPEPVAVAPEPVAVGPEPVVEPAPVPEPTVEPEPAAPPAPPAPVEPDLAPTPEPPPPAPEPAPFDAEAGAAAAAYDPALAAELKGKTFKGAMQHLATRTKTPVYADIANRVAGMATALENAGMKFDFSIYEKGGRRGAGDRAPSDYLARRPSTAGVSISRGPQGLGFSQVGIAIRGAPSSPAEKGANEQTLLHEGIHAVTSSLLGSLPRLPQKSRVREAAKQLEDLTAAVSAHLSSVSAGEADMSADGRAAFDRLRGSNAFESKHELLSWGLTNYDMQTVLKSIPVEKNKNAFTKFVEIIGKMLGVGPKDYNALRRLIEVSETLIPTEPGLQKEVAEAATYKPEGIATATKQVAEERGVNANLPQIEYTLAMAMPSVNGAKKTAGDWLATLDRKFGNKYRDINPLMKPFMNAYGLTVMPEPFNIEGSMGDLAARIGGATQVFDRNQLDPFRKAILKSGVDPQDLGMYLWARAAKDRNRIVADRNADFPDGGSGLTDAEAQMVLDDFLARGLTPKLAQLAKVHDDIVDAVLDLRVKAGLMSAKEAAQLRKDQPLYTPLKGFAKDGDMSSSEEDRPHDEFDALRRTQMGVRPGDYLRTEGRVSMPFNPAFSLMADAQNAVMRAEKNRATIPFLNTLLLDPDAFADVAKVYTDKKPKRVEGGLDPKTKKRKFRSMSMRANAGQFLVVKKDGVAHYIDFLDTDGGRQWKRVFQNMAPKEYGKAMQIYRAFAAGVKQLMTKFNPTYLFRNAPWRDVQDAIATAYLDGGMPGGPAAGKQVARKALRNTFSLSGNRAAWKWLTGKAPSNPEQAALMDLYESMIRDGGSDGYAIFSDAEGQAKAMQKKIDRLQGLAKNGVIPHTKQGIEAVGDLITHIYEFVNNFARFGVYRAAVERNISPVDAARIARNSTVDLTRKGESSNILDAFYFFSNPTIQSGIKQAQMLKSKRAKVYLGAMVTVGALLSISNHLISGDDDDDGISNYDALDETKKMTNLVIYYGGGANDYLIFPMGFLVSFPVYAGQKMADLAYDVAKPEGVGAAMMGNLMDLAKGFAQSYSPIRVATGEPGDIPSSLTPSVLKPLVDVTRNKDYFGGTIYDDPYREGQSRASMGRPTTGEGYKLLAQTLNDATGGAGKVKGWADANPETYRYFVNSFLGGPARTAKDFVNMADATADGEMDARKVPVLRAYLGSGGEYAAQNDFYDRSPRMDQVRAVERDGDEDTWAALEKKYPTETDPDVIAAYEDAKSRLSDFYEARADATEGVSAGERRKIVKEMKPEKDEIYADFNRVYNEVKDQRGR